jgi:3-hydroxyacyl-[acyl-carrier-protein] dehydratase
MRFILLDRIISLEPGRSIHAVKTMPADEELFLDHFPGFPVVPGVLLVEMMAQAAGKCLHTGDTDRGLAMLGKINSATFRDWVRPGQLIDVFAEVRSRLGRPRNCFSASCREIASLPAIGISFSKSLRVEPLEIGNSPPK